MNFYRYKLPIQKFLSWQSIGLLIFSCSVVANDIATPVSVVTVKKGNIKQEVALTGTVTSPRSSMISPKEAGYIESLLVDEGDVVKQGDVLLQLDRQIAEIEITRVSAQLQEAIAQVKEFERQRDEAAELVEKKHIAATSFEAASAQVNIATAVVQRLRAELSRQKMIAERHTVFAPFDGVIVEKLVEVGQWVESNRSLFELIELNPLRIEVPVPQFYFNQVTVDTPVLIRYDSMKNKSYSAKVSKLIPVSDQTARTFMVFIRIDNQLQIVTPGMSARVILQLHDSEDTKSLLVPRDAIVQQPNGNKSIWIVSQQVNHTIANPVSVTTGKNVSNNVEITAGDLSDGDIIVVKGNELLQPGQSVNVIEQLDYQL